MVLTINYKRDCIGLKRVKEKNVMKKVNDKGRGYYCKHNKEINKKIHLFGSTEQSEILHKTQCNTYFFKSIKNIDYLNLPIFYAIWHFL